MEPHLVNGMKVSFMWILSLLLLCFSAVESKTHRGGFHDPKGYQHLGLREYQMKNNAHASHAFIRQNMTKGGVPSAIGKGPLNSVRPKLIKDPSVVHRNRVYASQDSHNTVTAVAPVESKVKAGNAFNTPSTDVMPTLRSALHSASMLSLWYAGTVMYNIENKKALNMCPLPKTIAALQMLMGIPFFMARWGFGMKPRPSVYTSNDGIVQEGPNAGILQSIKTKVRNSFIRAKNYIQAYSSILKQSALFSMIHVLSVTALGAGAISFVHIVKASEPLFVSAVSLLSGSGTMSPITFLTLIPILGGVAMASIKDLNFSSVAMATSLISNVLSSMRRLEAKHFFKQDLTKIGENLDAQNVSSLVTILSSCILAPLSLLECNQWSQMYRSILYKFSSQGLLLLARHIALSGFFYTLYTEVSFIALSQLAPVSHAVANTLKRIFLIVASSVLFKTKLTPAGIYGSATAITGALLYSLSKNFFG